MVRAILNLARRAPKTFFFRGYETADRAGEIRFHYSYDNGSDLCEVLKFDAPLPPQNSPLRVEFEAALTALSVCYGLRYYQGFTPREIVFDNFSPTAEQRAFFQDLFVNGLGEFGYRNDVDVAERVNFFDAPCRLHPLASTGPASEQSGELQASEAVADLSLSAAGLPRVSAVLMGGGKDSAVTIEVLRRAGEPMLLFAFNPTKPILDCAEKSGLPFVAAHHRKASHWRTKENLRAKKGMLPQSAIVSLTALAAAFVYGFDTIILSNERSADEGNLVHRGREINHQYCKSASFERSLRDYIANYVSSRLTYFSMLRPLSELHIARLFAKSSRYDSVFISCNQNRKAGEWCGECAKCRFAFLALATAMSPDRLRAIFGANLLDDIKQLAGYEELVGLFGHKPWDCVGEVEESAVAVLWLSSQPAWREAAIVRELAPRLRKLMPNPEETWRKYLTASPVHFMPDRFVDMLCAYDDGPHASTPSFVPATTAFSGIRPS